MSLGTGIAIAGLWVFSGLCAHSDTATGVLVIASIAIAAFGTAALMALHFLT